MREAINAPNVYPIVIAVTPDASTVKYRENVSRTVADCKFIVDCVSLSSECL